MHTPDRSLAINSAALQDHLLRSMGLKPPVKRSKPLPKPPSNLSKLGRNIISKNSSTILSSDPTMEQVRKKEQAYKDQLTLAQRLGLVEAPPAPLSENQWVEVEQQAVHRGMHTGNCPICHESLGKNPSVILSCSHIFHTVGEYLAMP